VDGSPPPCGVLDEMRDEAVGPEVEIRNTDDDLCVGSVLVAAESEEAGQRCGHHQVRWSSPYW
jgi:hypothetical protein